MAFVVTSAFDLEPFRMFIYPIIEFLLRQTHRLSFLGQTPVFAPVDMAKDLFPRLNWHPVMGINVSPIGRLRRGI